MSVECSGCRLPIPFIFPCSLCEYQEGCKRSQWEVKNPDYLRDEFIEYLTTGKKSKDLED